MLFITRDKIRLSSPQHTPVTGTACHHSAACDPFRHRCLNRHWCGSSRSCTVGTRRWQRRQQGSATPLRHPPHLATRLPHYRCSVECFGHEDLWHRNRATSPSCNPCPQLSSCRRPPAHCVIALAPPGCYSPPRVQDSITGN
jgi:hypothetical protein